MYEIPRNQAAVKQLLRAVNIQAPDGIGLSQLSATEGEKFAERLTRLANQDGVQPRDIEYLQSVTLAAHPDTRKAAKEAAYDRINIGRVIEIAKREGRTFRNAIQMILEAKDRHEKAMAIQYLSTLFEEEGVGEEDFAPTGPGLVSTEAVDFPVQLGAPIPVQNRVPKESPSTQPPRCESKSIQTSSSDSHPDQRKFGESSHIYGGTAALCFCECEVKQGNKATVMIEAALKEADRFNWVDKIALMLSVSELPMVLGFFCGYLPGLKLGSHGQSMDKSIELENQGDKFFVKLSARGKKVRAVPMLPRDSYSVITMLIRQMQKNDPNLSANLILSLSEKLCSMHARKAVEND